MLYFHISPYYGVLACNQGRYLSLKYCVHLLLDTCICICKHFIGHHARPYATKISSNHMFSYDLFCEIVFHFFLPQTKYSKLIHVGEVSSVDSLKQ